MNREKWTEAAIQAMNEILETDAVTSRHIKTPGREYIGVYPVSEKAVPVFNVDVQYSPADTYEDVKKIVETFVRAEINEYNQPDFDDLISEENLTLRLVDPTQTHLDYELLPHQDIATTLGAVLVFDDGKGRTAIATKEALTKLDTRMYPELAFAIARTHLRKENRPLLFPLNQVQEGSFIELGMETSISNTEPYVLTLQSGNYGASALALPEIGKIVSTMLGKEDFYIVPSSIEEVIIVPSSMGINPYELGKMVKFANDNIVPNELFLSDSIWEYKRDLQKTMVAEDDPVRLHEAVVRAV